MSSCWSPATEGLVHVVVVCHNVGVEDIRSNVLGVPDGSITFLQLDDGLASPSGPKNLGLAQCKTPYVLVLDSDDYLEAGALEHWLDVIKGTAADGVIAPLKLQTGDVVRTPRARVFRRHSLDAVKDQLAYATAPRGLWSTELLRSMEFSYTQGLRTAEDLAPGLALWFSGARLEFPADGPHYVLGEDASDRVTAEFLPLMEEFQAVAGLQQAWLEALSADQRQSIATKLVRIHLAGALVRRGPGWGWPESDRLAVREFMDKVVAISPAFAGPLTMAEQSLIAAVSAPGADAGSFQNAVEEFAAASYWHKLLAPGILDNAKRDSALRHQLRLKFHALVARARSTP
ncbi:glycosyltransferase family 2 protein [Arthrobacter sp. A2-55]|nr:glycosyltransferase family 2 protein [Arthrobacter sp. A2-55]